MSRHFLLLAMALAACSPRLEPGDSATAGGAELDTIAGTVRVVGSAPVNVQVVLSTADDANIRITGALRGELEKLSGLPVTVYGRVRRSADPMVNREIEVSGYEIGLVNGRPVLVGEIVQLTGQQAQLRTPDGDLIYLSGVPADLRVGQKVWVQGPSTLVVQSYGVLRP